MSYKNQIESMCNIAQELVCLWEKTTRNQNVKATHFFSGKGGVCIPVGDMLIKQMTEEAQAAPFSSVEIGDFVVLSGYTYRNSITNEKKRVEEVRIADVNSIRRAKDLLFYGFELGYEFTEEDMICNITELHYRRF